VSVLTTAVDTAAALLGGRALRDVPVGALPTYRVGGRAEALAVPGIEGLEISIPLGRRVSPLP